MIFMKKIIETEGMCCKKCAERAEKKLLLADGVSGARANYKKGVILVESSLTDEELISIVTEAGFTVKEVRERKGIFSR
ncbi:MAG: cation transporter, partial [Clostridia bacterium]|nr:cation transporter [Clostridia bacterium]